MDLAHPLAVITPTVDGDVLRVLAGATAEFTPGQVHRLLSEHSASGIAKVLARLTDQGIVHRRRAGSAYLYQLNRDHLAAPHIIALAQQRHMLLTRLAETVTGWASPPVYGALFGSGARDDHSTTSDLDLFLVRPDDVDEDLWDEQTGALAQQATQWTGNDARILEFSESEVRVLANSEPVLTNIAEEGSTFAGETSWLRNILVGTRTPKRRGAR